MTFFKGLQFSHKKLKFEIINKTEKSNFKVGGGVTKKQYKGGNSLIRGGLDSL